jgi:hypothetical protein
MAFLAMIAVNDKYIVGLWAKGLLWVVAERVGSIHQNNDGIGVGGKGKGHRHCRQPVRWSLARNGARQPDR